MAGRRRTCRRAWPTLLQEVLSSTIQLHCCPMQRSCTQWTTCQVLQSLLLLCVRNVSMRSASKRWEQCVQLRNQQAQASVHLSKHACDHAHPVSGGKLAAQPPAYAERSAPETLAVLAATAVMLQFGQPV